MMIFKPLFVLNCRVRQRTAAPAGRRGQQGFVMLAVIWVLLAMLAGVALLSHWVHNSLQHAHQRQNSINARIAGHSVESVALYIRLTGHRSAYGVTMPRDDSTLGDDELFAAMFEMDDMGGLSLRHDAQDSTTNFAFDSTRWRYGRLNFVAQDAAGLMGMTDIGHQSAARYLLAGQNTRLRPQQLVDSYLDYRDADNDRLLQGAEAFDYRLQQRAEPFNGALRTPLQLRDVMHWDRVLERWSNGELLYLLRVEGGVAVNVNSAPEQVLAMVYNNPELAEALALRRAERPIDSVFEVEAIAQTDEIASTIQPAAGLRFWWWEQDSPSAWVSEFHYDAFTPGPAALSRDWMLRVDVPPQLARQQGGEISWSLLPAFPDYLGR